MVSFVDFFGFLVEFFGIFLANLGWVFWSFVENIVLIMISSVSVTDFMQFICHFQPKKSNFSIFKKSKNLKIF